MTESKVNRGDLYESWKHLNHLLVIPTGGLGNLCWERKTEVTSPAALEKDGNS